MYMYMNMDYMCVVEGNMYKYGSSHACVYKPYHLDS